MGRKGRSRDFPESKRFRSVQGDTFSAAHQPDTQLCERVGEDCVRSFADVVSCAFVRHNTSYN